MSNRGWTFWAALLLALTGFQIEAHLPWYLPTTFSWGGAIAIMFSCIWPPKCHVTIEANNERMRDALWEIANYTKASHDGLTGDQCAKLARKTLGMNE